MQYRRMSRKDRREVTKNLKKDKEAEPHGRASLPAYVVNLKVKIFEQ